MLTDPLLLIITITTILAGILAVSTKNLTIPAAVSGIFLANLLLYCSGIHALLFMAAFFILGVWATHFRLDWKQHQGLAKNTETTRSSGQVFANAGAAGLISLAAHFFPSFKDYAMAAVAATFASATSDTISSEMGNAMGRRHFHILSFKPATPGGNGIISLEGIQWGILASVMIGLLYAALEGWSHWVIIIIIAGFLGNLSDSVLGATLENKKLLSNNLVNFLNTLIAALITWGLMVAFPRSL